MASGMKGDGKGKGGRTRARDQLRLVGLADVQATLPRIAGVCGKSKP